jgi:hypothetical protein
VEPTPTPTAAGATACEIVPRRGFGTVYTQHPTVSQRLGCPTAGETILVQSAEQNFERGYMFWDGDSRRVFVFLTANNTWRSYPDTWVEGSPPAEVLTPPAGLYQPVRGFGKVWLEQPEVRNALGWATNQERLISGAVWQPYEDGGMIWTDARLIRALYNSGNWEIFQDTFTEP